MIAIVVPIVERFARPLTNKYIEKAFVWIFSKKERLKFESKIAKEYTNNNPQPQMTLSTVDSYYTK